MPQFTTHGTKVPVSVITGFLGSGKSTLVNYLLQARGEKNICVIENEFGEVNIDKTLVGDTLAEREDLVSIENGCVCCSLRKDIVKAFDELQRRSDARGKAMDHILLETTGLADPSPVAFTFFANPWIAARFKLDSITCVVDAKHLMQHLQDGKHPGPGTVNEAVQQLAFSDLILLNKVDLVTESEKAEVLDAIRTINTTARVLECQLNDEAGRPQLSAILGTNTFSVQRALAADPQFLDTDSDPETEVTVTPASLNLPMGNATDQAVLGSVAALEPCKSRGESDSPRCANNEVECTSIPAPTAAAVTAAPMAAVGQKRAHCQDEDEDSGPQGEKQPKCRRKKLHDLSDVSSVGITTKGQLDEYRFNMYMRDLLTEKAKDIFRCKGVLCVHGYGNKKFVFQGVHETICYGPAQVPWQQEEPRINQIVFIGKGLNRKMLTEGFKTCLWVPLPPDWSEAVDEHSKRPYFYNQRTGEKSWTRPVCGRTPAEQVISSHASTQQPLHRRPSRAASSNLLVPVQVSSATAAAGPSSTDSGAVAVA